VHGRRQDHGGEPSWPVMSRSPDRRSSLERGSPETKPRRMRACSTGVFGSCLRPCAPPSRSRPPLRDQIFAPEPLKANMRAGC
jgi:hypothetical protein